MNDAAFSRKAAPAPATATTKPASPGPTARAKLNSIGCGYFLATRKALRNQVIFSNVAAGMSGNSRVIEKSEEYPRV
jgi:hypothetical protein